MGKTKVNKGKKKKARRDVDVDVSGIVKKMSKKFEVEVMDKDTPDRVPYYIPFRHIGLQMITGGVPGARFTEIRGDSQCGKSYLIYELGLETLKMGGVFLLNDPENAYETAYGRRVGLEGNNTFAFSSERVLEDCFLLYRDFITRVRVKNKKCPILIGCDSYPPIQTILTKAEIEQQLKENGAKKLKGYREAKKNALFSNLMGEFLGFIEETNTTFILLNQLKKKIGVVFGDDTTSNADNIIRYYTTLRLQGTLGKRIKNKATGRRTGMWSKWETIKSRRITPFKSVSTKILYQDGVDRMSGLSELLVAEGKVKKVKGKPKLVDYKGRKVDIPKLMDKRPKLFRPLLD